MFLVLPLSGMSNSNMSVPMDSVLKQINQDTCLKLTSNKQFCDSIHTVYINRLLVDNINESDVRMFYNWCMSDGTSKTYRRLNRDWYKKKGLYVKFLNSCEYKLEYGHTIDSLIVGELKKIKYKSYSYQLYSKQIYCYESVLGEKMALIRFFICQKDDFWYNRNDVMHVVFDSFPESYFAIINLEKETITRFILL